VKPLSFAIVVPTGCAPWPRIQVIDGGRAGNAARRGQTRSGLARQCDRSCADFYGYVNAKWVAANPVPADRTRWGTFDELREASLKAQRAIIEDPAIAKHKPARSNRSSAISMPPQDEAAVEKPARRRCSRSEENRRNQACQRLDCVSDRRHAHGRGQVFDFGAQPDFRIEHGNRLRRETASVCPSARTI